MKNKFAYTLPQQAINQALTKKEEKRWEFLKLVIVFTFFIALIGAALDLLV